MPSRGIRERGGTMGKLWVGLIFITLVTLVALVGLAVDPATLAISEAQPPVVRFTPRTAPISPVIAPAGRVAVEMTPAEEVTQQFYDWYVAALGTGTSSPLTDGAYRSSPYLSVELVHELDGIVASFGDGSRYDPILFAATTPQIVSVRLESLADDEARVTVRESWPDVYQDILVRLQPADGRWKLVDLTRPIIDTRDNGTPQHAARVFYNWYTEYARRVGNPLTDRAYQGGALSPALQDRIEAARLTAAQWPVDDPILLGQDLSAGFDVNLDDSDGGTAVVWVRGVASDDSRNDTMALYVSLQKTDGRWIITDVARKPMA
jgi:hypothetical protein